MDQFFKTLRAREEIKRLNIEIRRVVTWIQDKNCFLCWMEANLRDSTGKMEDKMETDIQMAVQVCLYHARRGRFDAAHLRHFSKLAAEPGFMGSLRCGVAVEQREVGGCLQDLQGELEGMGRADEIDASTEETGAGMELDPGAVAADAEVAADAHHHGAEMVEDDEGDEVRDEVVAGLLYRISMLATDDRPQDGADE
jgi:hypothetical protein